MAVVRSMRVNDVLLDSRVHLIHLFSQDLSRSWCANDPSNVELLACQFLTTREDCITSLAFIKNLGFLALDLVVKRPWKVISAFYCNFEPWGELVFTRHWLFEQLWYKVVFHLATSHKGRQTKEQQVQNNEKATKIAQFADDLLMAKWIRRHFDCLDGVDDPLVQITLESGLKPRIAVLLRHYYHLFDGARL